MKLLYFSPHASVWPAQIEAMRARLGAPHNPHLLPEHFLKVVLPKLGGHIAEIQEDGKEIGYAILFPRGLENQRKEYTARYHALPGAAPLPPAALTHLVETELQAGVFFYDPAKPKHYAAGHHPSAGSDFGAPDAEEAEAMRRLQQQVWGNPPDLLYPADLHSVEFRLATSLVVRDGGVPVGFLFGFYKFGGFDLPSLWHNSLNGDLRIESQTMGVLPSQRGRAIGFTLKQRQAEKAQREGIDIINWTADPLLFTNAVLNFSKLRAVALHFHPALYALQNDLNRLPASRLSLTWFVGSERVRSIQPEDRTGLINLAERRQIARVNEDINRTDFAITEPVIAIEIPADWYTLQHADLEAAQRWRTLTDRLFAHYIGPELGQYAITAAGVDGTRRYLVAERVDDGLVERLLRP